MKIFIVENSLEIRQRLCALIAEVPGAQVLGMADSAQAAMEGIAAAMPDLITLDLHLASGGGIAVLRQIKAMRPKAMVIVLTAMDYPLCRQKCLAAGADYFLVKSSDSDIATLPVLLAEVAIAVDRGQIEGRVA